MATVTECKDCHEPIVLVLYLPDLTKRRPGKGRSYVPLDAAPAARDDDTASYALNISRTVCHLITDDYPLEQHEKRHHIHPFTCRERHSSTPVTPEGVSA